MFMFCQDFRSEVLVSGTSSSFPACLSSLVTLSIPVEQKVQRFTEQFSHALADLRSRVTILLGRSEEIGQQTMALRQKTENVEKDVAEMKRQQSNLSEEFVRYASDSEQRQGELEKQAISLELRTTLLEDKTDCNESLTSEMERLAEQMEDVRERVVQAEGDAAKTKIKCDDLEQQQQNSRNTLPSHEDQQALLQRLESMEKKMQKLEGHFPILAPQRSISHP